MCSFARRCSNFIPENDDPRKCVLLCSRNPSAMIISLLPDRFYEPVKDSEEGVEKVLNAIPRQNVEYADKFKSNEPKSKDEQMEDMIKTYQDSEGEVMEYEEEIAKPTKFLNPKDIMKKVSPKPSDDKMIAEAIEGEEPTTNVIQLPDMKIVPAEQTLVAETDIKKPNVKNYIPTGNVGRPKMSDEEKETAKGKRDIVKAIEQKQKDADAIERSARLKQQRVDQLAKARASKKKKPKKKGTKATN